MFSRWRERLRHTLGFRLALWYALVFVASTLALTVLTYVLGARQEVTFLRRPEGWRRFDLSRLEPPSSDGEPTWSIVGTGRRGDELEVLSVRLRDGTLFQVGMSAERRMQLLERFRRVLLVNVASLIV